MEVVFSEAPRLGGDAVPPPWPEVAAQAGEGSLLREQLDYLIDHVRECVGRCPECIRFAAVREALMRIWR